MVYSKLCVRLIKLIFSKNLDHIVNLGLFMNTEDFRPEKKAKIFYPPQRVLMGPGLASSMPWRGRRWAILIPCSPK